MMRNCERSVNYQRPGFFCFINSNPATAREENIVCAEIFPSIFDYIFPPSTNSVISVIEAGIYVIHLINCDVPCPVICPMIY